MNNIINLPTVISKIASTANVELAVARKFVHDMIVLVEESLKTGEEAEIPSVGRFVLSGDNIIFIPDAALAEIVNEPFSAFVPVEIKSQTDNQTEQPEKQDATENGDTKSIYTPPVYIPEEEPSQPEGYDSPDQNTEKPDETEQIAPSYQVNTAKSSPSIWIVLGILIGLIIGLVLGYFAGKSMAKLDPVFADEYVMNNLFYDDSDEEDAGTESVDTEEPLSNSNDDEQTTPEITTPAEQTADQTPTVNEPVYDLVTKSLSRLASTHYGSSNYWVFIYQANPQLGNPNQIAPGTKVLIPDYNSFAEPTKELTDEKARKIMNELSKKYNF